MQASANGPVGLRITLLGGFSVSVGELLIAPEANFWTDHPEAFLAEMLRWQAGL